MVIRLHRHLSLAVTMAECLLGPTILSSILDLQDKGEGLGEVTAFCHPWVPLQGRGSIPWGRDLDLILVVHCLHSAELAEEVGDCLEVEI